MKTNIYIYKNPAFAFGRLFISRQKQSFISLTKMSNISKLTLFLLLIFLVSIQGFVPHPSIRMGGQAGQSKF